MSASSFPPSGSLSSPRFPLISLISIIVISIISLFIFQSGFLLKRIELAEKSRCGDVSLRLSSCWLPPRFSRAVLVVVDALRYDFLHSTTHEDRPWAGHMPFTRELTKRGAFVAKAVADPPTTTLQRLKALGTGGLPTFIDAGENFSNDAQVHEDNILSQLQSSGRNATLLGDSTWMSLYPRSFHRHFEMDSFDIHDLHTVDNHVLAHLPSELSRSDWTLLIAHFLGVDHAGHKHGPLHLEMAAKLKQMDRVIRDVVGSLKEGDFLIVMGDHGMTTTGDHGGESDDETGAAFMAYSPGVRFSDDEEEGKTIEIRQIDIVPTLSLLLDLPIPFSSLGSPIEQLFEKDTVHMAVHLTAMQIERFASTYSRRNGGLSLSLPAELPLSSADQRALISRLQLSLRAQWTQFSVPLMRIALLSLVDCIGSLFTTASLSALIVRNSHTLLLLTLIISHSPESSPALTLLTITLPLSILYSLFSVLSSLAFSKASFPSLFPLSLTVLSCLLPFSNSFVVYEPSILRFLLSSLLIFSFINSHISRVRSSPSDRRFISSSTFSSLPLLFFVLFLLRLQPLFHRCREEEYDCIQFSSALPSSTLPMDSRLPRFILSIVSTLFIHRLFRPPSFPPRSPLLSLSSSLLNPILLLTILHFSSSLLPDHLSILYSSHFKLVALSIYGLSSLSLLLALFSSPSPHLPLSILHNLTFPLLLILGEGISPSLLCLLFIFLSLSSLLPSSLLPFSFSLLLPFSFYFLSHSPTLSSLPWHAAFVGVQGSSVPRVIAGFLVFCHLFTHSILAGPLLSHLTKSPKLSSYRNLLAASILRVLLSSTAAMLLRRHLMVWKIFAPHWIFSSLSFVVLGFSIFFSTLLSRKSFT